MTEGNRERRPGATTPYVQYVMQDQSISNAVIDAVTTVSGRDPLCDGTASDTDGDGPLDPLYGAVDPDALDAIFRPGGENARPMVVRFTYCGYGVTVESTGQITITAD